MTADRPAPPDRHQAAGEAHYRAGLTAAGVAAIRRRVAAGETLTAIHADFPRVGWSALQKAAAGTSWKGVEGARPVAGRLPRWTPEQDAYLREHAAEPDAELAAALRRSVTAMKVRRTRLGLTRQEPASLAGKALASARRVATYACAECGAAFEAVARTGTRAPRYCSQRCGARARHTARAGAIGRRVEAQGR